MPPETTGLAAAEAQLRALAIEEAGRGSAARCSAATQKDLEEQIAAVTERRDSIEQRMYATTSSSVRDLQAMNEEVRHLTERRAELEEQELVVTLDLDPIDAEIQAARDRKAPVEQQVDERRGQVAVQQREIDAELATVTGSRVERRAQLPGPWSDRYETLRAQPQRQPGPLVSSRTTATDATSSCPRSRSRDPRAAPRRDRHLRAVRAHPRPRAERRDAVLILVRHGESVANAAGPPARAERRRATEQGRAQACGGACAR